MGTLPFPYIGQFDPSKVVSCSSIFLSYSFFNKDLTGFKYAPRKHTFPLAITIHDNFYIPKELETNHLDRLSVSSGGHTPSVPSTPNDLELIVDTDGLEEGKLTTPPSTPDEKTTRYRILRWIL